MLDRAKFDHVGIVTPQDMPGARFDEGGRSWITNPRVHPAHVEWIRFEPDSPVQGPLRTQAHVAYRVDDLDVALEECEVIYPPYEVGDGFMRAAFVLIDGAVVELVQYRDPNEEGWWF
jgi:hypothetical protein